MKYDYEPLLEPENDFFKALKKLEKEILHKSLKPECDFNLEKLKTNPDFRKWFENSIIDLEKEFIIERKKLTENKTYFFGCSFEIYKLSYETRLQSYLKKYYDATEHDFVEYELSLNFDAFFYLRVNRYDLDQKLERCFLETLESEQIFFSLKARYKFLTDKLNNIVTPGLFQSDYLGYPTNESANKLFDYLINYYRPNEKTSVKYVNILEYLKKDANKDLYIFNIKQLDFKDIVKSKVGIDIKKFAISERYNDVEKPILNSLEASFRNENKSK